MADVTIAQDVEFNPLVAGLSYLQTVDALSQSNTDGLTQLWSGLRAFEPTPPRQVEVLDGHCAVLTSMGDCMPSGPQEGEEALVDDRLPIRPGDLAAFVYRRGSLPQCKTYLGKWTGGNHSMIAGDRRIIDVVYVFAQESPAALVLVPEQDMVAAIRVADIDPWTVDARGWPDCTEILALLDDVDLPQSPIDRYLTDAEAERQAFFQFLIARFNDEEEEAFYQRHPQARVMARRLAP